MKKNLLKSGLIDSPLFRAFAALIVVFILGIIFNADGAFFKWGTHRDMLRLSSVFGILACGMTIVILTGGIDLSVGSVLAITAVSFAILKIHMGLSTFVSILACLGIGISCGTASGILVSKFKMQPFIATLSLMVFARGLAKWVSGGQKISTAVQQADGTYKYVDLPAIFKTIDSRILNDNIATVTLIFLICMLVSWILISYLKFGRHIYAIGGNEEAARLSGVPVTKTKIIAYALSGLFCAIAGICQAAQEQQGDPQAGVTYELTAIAMVVIGGTSLMGGRGGILLTFVGVLVMGYLDKILSINAVGEDKRLLLTGVIIVAAVLLQKASKR